MFASNSDAYGGSVNLSTMSANRIKIDRSELVERVHPDNAPYYVLLSMLDFEPCSQEKYSFLERDDFQSTVTVAAAANATATTVVLSGTDYNRVVDKQHLFNPRTGEHLFVNGAVSSASITVARAVEGDLTTGSAIVAGDTLYVLPTVMEYGSEPVDTINLEPSLDYNYVEKNRKGWKVDGRAEAVELYGPNALDYVKTDNQRAFMRELEMKFLMGVRAKQTISSKIYTFSGGVNYFITKSGSRALTRDFSGVALTKNTFDNFLQEYRTQAGTLQGKMVLCGWNLIRIINGWGNDKLVYNDKFDKVGLSVRKYTSDYGDINLMPHELWNTELNLQDEAWIVDLGAMKRRGLKGRSDITMTTTRGSTELQALGEDAVHQELTVEDGLELRHTERFAKMSGIFA